ncbi:MAG: DUF1361 domain-containing protein, partial [Bacteroidota bacterium]
LNFSKFRQISIGKLTICVILLSAFGVYLGRFLRYNSWEIVSNPQVFITDVIRILISPSQNSEAWLFTIVFGGFLIVGYWLFKNLNHIRTHED